MRRLEGAGGGRKREGEGGGRGVGGGGEEMGGGGRWGGRSKGGRGVGEGRKGRGEGGGGRVKVEGERVDSLAFEHGWGVTAATDLLTCSEHTVLLEINPNRSLVHCFQFGLLWKAEK